MEARIGFALTGSFCTFDKALEAAQQVRDRFGDLIPIASANAAGLDTRFGTAADFMGRLEAIAGRPALRTLTEAEPIGPKKLLDALVVCPCTGNTLAKLAAGIADTPVALAVKAHLRNGRPVVLAVSTNDGLAAAAKNIGLLLDKKHLYFVPFGQDDPVKKPSSLVADFSRTADAVAAALAGQQLQPVLI